MSLSQYLCDPIYIDNQTYKFKKKTMYSLTPFTLSICYLKNKDIKTFLL